jgi:magnesium and cobalt exporter, CNNM family
MFLLVFYLLLAILVSFLCSILEAVLLSVTPSYIAINLQEKKKVAFDLQKFKDNIDRPLAAILTLNTFAHTIGAAGVGAQAQEVWGNEYLSVASAVMTILILIFSEIIPKTIGATFWEKLVGFSIVSIKLIMWVLYPFVILSQFITGFIRKDQKGSVLGRVGLSAMAEAGAKEGLIRTCELKIIQNIARYDKLRAKDIMTPRSVVFAASENETMQAFYKANAEAGFSRIPIYHDSLDKVEAYVLKDELLMGIIDGHGNKMLSTISRDLQFVYENMPIPELYKLLLGENEHIVLVVDEYGVTAGIVSMEDVIETLLGLEIVDEMDDVADMQKLAREQWHSRAKQMGIDLAGLP